MSSLVIGSLSGAGADTSVDSYMEPLDVTRREQFGEHYDPKAFRKCRVGRAAQDETCGKYRLRRRELAVHYPFPGVPTPEFPELPSGAAGYRIWMNARAYFEHLCKTDAGKFINRSVEDVRSVFQMRPRLVATDDELSDRYVMPDPYGYTTGEAYYPGFAFVGQGRYQSFETTLYERERRDSQKKHYNSSFFSEAPTKARYIRYSGYDRHDMRTMVKRYTNKLISRYGYMWRDVQRPRDREHGVAGGELIVLDLKTNEILALWRGYQWSERGRGVWWKSGLLCPSWPKDSRDIFEFVSEVLKPAPF